ncbi:NUBPL iron-transfer P-loop NTPase [Hamiltosporidium tvaerminnensis]|uniref:NUBPL iron-transfer P-loop NTPase n=1 Tax=Hamiltosporidium tvaerminnensis TaxID=1176355 RepID=A0A4Q9M3X0_9MICR|nr:NUBPL iron-transfer P-loop NTPase [Hamiltosporidium tvaerminnensis]
MRKIAIMSGKGGVGKTSFTSLLACILQEKYKVLLLDFDICGPSLIFPFGVSGKVKKNENGFIPIKLAENLDILSMAFMIKESDSVNWRGPKKNILLEMFYNSRFFKDYDFVVVDMPPGISEEHNFLIGKDFEAVLVTTSQNLALNGVIAAYNFCIGADIKIIGLIENMSGLVCDECGTVNKIYSCKGGSLVAEQFNLIFFGFLEFEVEMFNFIDSGKLLCEYKKLKSYNKLEEVIERYF